jgi:hypothetical protein
MAKFNVAIGDKVAYSVQFLKSIGASHSDMAHARGEVTAVDIFGGLVLARIKWNADMPERVNVANLAKVGANTRFANCD